MLMNWDGSIAVLAVLMPDSASVLPTSLSIALSVVCVAVIIFAVLGDGKR